MTNTSRPPNILIILSDQQQADAMSCAGNGDLHTPNLDALAARGVRFTRAYSTFPLCGPCRASWALGQYPHSIGYMVNSLPLPPALASQTFGHRLRAAGYATAYGGKWHVPEIDLAHGNAELCGFEFVCGFNDHHLPVACSAYLRRSHDRPFCLVASFDNPHNICEHSRDQSLPWGEVAEGDPSCYPNLPVNFAPPAYESGILASRRRQMPNSIYSYTPDRWRRYRHSYYRLCEMVDAGVGGILQTLRETGLQDNTIVIFMSDHGDMAGSHDLPYKSVFYEESARVPCILADPTGQLPRGQTCDALLNTGIDLFPTLLDYAGAAPDPTLPGMSLRQAAGQNVSARRDHVVCQSQYDGSDIQARMVRSQRYKYVVHVVGPNREMLFDMEQDPGEMLNLAVESRYQPVLEQHRKLLYQWCLTHKDNFGAHYSHAAHPVLPGSHFTDAPPRAGAILS